MIVGVFLADIWINTVDGISLSDKPILITLNKGGKWAA